MAMAEIKRFVFLTTKGDEEGKVSIFGIWPKENQFEKKISKLDAGLTRFLKATNPVTLESEKEQNDIEELIFKRTDCPCYINPLLINPDDNYSLIISAPWVMTPIVAFSP